MPNLTIAPDVVFSIALKAPEYGAKVDQTDPDSASNPTDDSNVDALEFGLQDQTRHELVSAVSDLNDDEQLDLIVLIYLGRGDFTLAEWAQARRTATEIDRQRTPRYIAEIPLVSDYLEEGLSLFGESIQDHLDQHCHFEPGVLVAATSNKNASFNGVLITIFSPLRRELSKL